jgi:two-component system, chemotaxis family, CheB/CheR fusion protein
MNGINESGVPGFTVVGIGASAGGIRALKEFFERMPVDSGMAFIAIMHLSKEHESSLANILQTCTSMPVTQVTQTVKIEPNHVYVIPPSHDLEMVDGAIKLTEPERIRGKRLPVDLFLRSLAAAHGKDGVAVILSGTGSDGSLGLKRIKENGGTVFVQDPLDAEYDGMPQSAIATNAVDVILPVAQLPGEDRRDLQVGGKAKASY